MNKIYPWNMSVYMEMWNIFILSIKSIHETNKYTCVPSLWPFTDRIFCLLLCSSSQESSQSQIHNSQHYEKSKAELKTWFLLQFMKVQTSLHMLSHQPWKKEKTQEIIRKFLKTQCSCQLPAHKHVETGGLSTWRSYCFTPAEALPGTRCGFAEARIATSFSVLYNWD